MKSFLREPIFVTSWYDVCLNTTGNNLNGDPVPDLDYLVNQTAITLFQSILGPVSH